MTPTVAPYDGPFRVLRHGDKSLVVDVGGRPETVSIDRIKPAHVDVSRPLDLAQFHSAAISTFQHEQEIQRC